MKQVNLFAPSPDSVNSDVFESWLNSRFQAGEVRSPATILLYKEIWRSFSNWCGEQTPPIALATVTPSELLQFQSSRTGADNPEISPRHALRVLRLIGKVLAHHSRDQNDVPNRAAVDAIIEQPHIRYAEAADQDKLPQALCPADADRLIAFLWDGQQQAHSTAVDISWQVTRNKASAALQLGAGLGPVEIRSLILSSIVNPAVNDENASWKVQVPATGESDAHEAPIARWASDLLRAWLQTRANQQIPGPWLFPSTQSGKPWSKVAQYNAAKQVMLDAGLAISGGGSFILRHTFALRQLRRGTAPEQLARWMGVNDAKVMQRYSRTLMLMEPVV